MKETSWFYPGQGHLDEMRHGHRLFVVGLVVQILAGPALLFFGVIPIGLSSGDIGAVVGVTIAAGVAGLVGLILTIVGITMFMGASEDAVQALLAELDSVRPGRPIAPAGTVQGHGFYYTPASEDRQRTP